MRFTAAILSVVGASAFLIACPSAPAKPAPGSTEVDGTVGGVTLTSVSAVSDIVPFYPPNNQPAIAALRIRFSNKDNSCEENHQASSTVMTFTLLTETPLANGTFTIVGSAPGDHQALVTFQNLDANCTDSIGQTATGGTITIKGANFATGGQVNGSIDATFPGGTVSGAFYAESCNPSANVTGADSGSDYIACVP